MLVLTGSVGVGKSTVADAVSELLQWDHGIPHALANLDAFRRASPAPEDDPFHMALGFRNLAAVWGNYRAAGARCLVVDSVMEDGSDVAGLCGAVPGAHVFLARLVAPLEVIHARLRHRETSAESLRWHLERSAHLVRAMADKGVGDAVVDTAGRDPAAIARTVVDRWGVVEWYAAGRGPA